MREYYGRRHCGAGTFRVLLPDATAIMRCDCSIWARKGIVLSLTTAPPDQVHVTAEDGALSTYHFGTHTARHHFCSRCGVHPFVETRLNPGHSKINLGCIEELDALRLPETLYPGKAL